MKAAVLPGYLHLPLFETLRNYRLARLRRDVIAGLSACIVSIASVIAYAELVHLPPIAGLYAALAAAIGYALFASSRQVTAAQRFAELHRELAEEGVDVKIADAPRPFLEELAKVGLSEEIGRPDFFASVKDAAEAFEKRYGAPHHHSGRRSGSVR
jgi:MFS superfamily sulfate permease-like transporter